MPSTIDVSNEVPELIEAAAQKLGSMALLAKKLGVKHGTISQVAKRQKTLGPDLARRLAPALGMTQLQLFQLAGLITETYDEQDSRAVQRIKLMLRDADADTIEEAADVVEAIVSRRTKINSARTHTPRHATRKT